MSETEFFIRVMLNIGIFVSIAWPLTVFISKKLFMQIEKEIEEIIKEELKKHDLY